MKKYDLNFQAMKPEHEKPCRGLAILLGAGPGEANLITRAGAGWLGRADVVIYDRLVAPGLLSLCRPGAELVYVGKQADRHEMSQEQINRLLVDKVARGLLTVRLKGGDPFIFGRGGEEALALRQAGLDFRIVPGVTAAVAAAAYAGVPLTHRGAASSAAFITGHEDPAKEASAINWRALAGVDTLVFYMGVKNLPLIVERLTEAGLPADTPAMIVQNAASPDQRCVCGKLDELPELARRAGIEPPALTIIGKTVSLHEQLDWFSRLPLAGKTVVVTRSRHQASELSAGLAELGARVIEAPTIDIRPPDDFSLIDAAISRLGGFDWLVLTSPNGVGALFDRLAGLGKDSRALAGLKIAVVGPGTANALARRSILADLVPDEFTTESLGLALVQAGISGKKILLARADIADERLTDSLSQAGAIVEDVAVYRTISPDGLPAEAVGAFKDEKVDWITFTSSSTARNFLALAEKAGLDFGKSKLAAIGPVTAETLAARGFKPTVTARKSTIDGLLQTIVRHELAD
ncbi:MAG: uroporphyrinogen-III C-methyltransferase [Planctomycetes bacterium]|nr:uroporphyrinogen-III C-methyltransferase [Planctomycetota bacterium]